MDDEGEESIQRVDDLREMEIYRREKELTECELDVRSRCCVLTGVRA